MPTQTKQQSQGLLFSEPSIAETGVWCELSDGIDPAQWAQVCRRIGQLNPQKFRRVQKKIMGNPNSFFSRLRRIFTFDQNDCKHLPLVSLKYSTTINDT